MLRPAIFSLSLIASVASLRAQCVPTITSVSDHGHEPTPHDVRIPQGTFIQASYALDGGDRLLLYSRAAQPGPHLDGIAILSTNRPLRYVNLSTLSILHPTKDFDVDFRDSYYAEKIAKGCSDRLPIYFVESHWDGDVISPELVIIIVRSESGYSVSTMPLISGGVLEISRSDARSLTVWSTLNEGECNACETPYEVSTFRLHGARPVRLTHQRTRRRYTSGDQRFDTEIRFVP